MSLRVTVHACRAIIRNTDDGGIVLRSVDSLDVSAVVVNTLVLRSVNTPDDHIGVCTAADEELAVGTPTNVINVHRVPSDMKQAR